jgi:predicted DNA-binding protein (UPF0251 family)
MALRVEEPRSEAQKLRELYAACDPAGWDACRLRGKPWPPQLYILSNTPWTDWADWKWTAWHKYLRRIALGFMRHPSARSRRGAERIEWDTRGGWVAGDIGIVEPVQAACALAGLTTRQIEVWKLSEGEQLSQREIALVLQISQPMAHRHLANARARLAQEWGIITSGLVIEGTSRGCAWRFRGFVCCGRCADLQKYPRR